MNREREYSPKRFAIASVSCPSCHGKLERDAKWCEACGFSGAKSLELFGDSPPPLLPILDVVDLWNAKEQKNIHAAIKDLNKRFPQVKWRVCAVALPTETSLPMFGFWLMNVCPLMPEESPEDREWTVLLLFDGNTGRASVTCGYRAEIWLSDEMWAAALMETVGPLQRGDPLKAVLMFLKSAESFFQAAWKRSLKQLETR